MAKKKILFNTWSGAFFNPGGGEVQLLQTERALANRGFRIEHYNQWEPQKDFDIFHQFSVQYGVNFPVNAYKDLQKKIVVSPILWGHFTPDTFAFWQIKELLERSDIILTNSNAETKKIAENFEVSCGKFYKTRNAIGEEYLGLCSRGDFKRQFNISGDFVLSVANIDRRKNTMALIEACAAIKKPLVLIGAVRDIEYFEQCAIKNNKNILFLGAIQDSETIKSAYRDCRVFALPSMCETPGIAALEAASQKASVVITQVGAAPEYFGSFARYIDPENTDTIKKQILEAWESSAPQEQVDFICESYRWDLAAADVEEAYGKVL